MLRNSIASLYLLVFQYKEGIVLHSICNYKTDHLFKKKRKKKSKQKKGQSERDVCSLFIFLIKRIPGKLKYNFLLLL